MQLISKKVIAFNLLLLHCSISFGCSNQNYQVGICDDNFIKIVNLGGGAVRNLLQKTNNELNKKLSINNNDFLLRLNEKLLTEVDIQKILLNALWRDSETDQKIVERYKIYYNQKEKISLKNFFGNNEFILKDKNVKLGFSLLSSSITFARIRNSKQLLLDNGIFKELNSFKTSNIHQELQVGALCGDVILVQTISKQIFNMFDKISDFIAENNDDTNYTTQRNGLYCVSLEKDRMDNLRDASAELCSFESNSIDSTKLLLLKLMYLNKKEIFQVLVDTNPLKIKNSSGWTTIVEYFQDDNIKTIDKNVNKAEYIQILEKQCVDINKKTVNNPEILCNNLLQNSKTMNNDNDKDGCIIF